MRGAIAVSAPLDGIEINRGKDILTRYQFNTDTAKHYFCSVCGIYTHHQRRSNPTQPNPTWYKCGLFGGDKSVWFSRSKSHWWNQSPFGFSIRAFDCWGTSFYRKLNEYPIVTSCPMRTTDYPVLTEYDDISKQKSDWSYYDNSFHISHGCSLVWIYRSQAMQKYPSCNIWLTRMQMCLVAAKAVSDIASC